MRATIIDPDGASAAPADAGATSAQVSATKTTREIVVRGGSRLATGMALIGLGIKTIFGKRGGRKE